MRTSGSMLFLVGCWHGSISDDSNPIAHSTFVESLSVTYQGVCSAKKAGQPSIGPDSVVDHGDSTGLFLQVLGSLENGLENILGIRVETELIQGERHVPSRREHSRRDLLDGNGTGSTSFRFLSGS